MKFVHEREQIQMNSSKSEVASLRPLQQCTNVINLCLNTSQSQSRKSSDVSRETMTIAVTNAHVTVTTPVAITTTSPAAMSLAMTRSSSPDDSSVSEKDEIGRPPTTTALRRLHFKSGRNARTKTTSAVPKVIVMGSSASTVETTINTSTESASTLVTSVTATDTSETCDSFDIADMSGQSEPLLSSLDEPPHASTSANSQESITEVELISVAPIKPFFNLDETENAESSLSIEPHKIPKTAPISSSVHFPFDPPSSPKSVKITQKNQSLFTFKETSMYLENQKFKTEHLNNIDSVELDHKFSLPPKKESHDKIKKLEWKEENEKKNYKRKDSTTNLEIGKSNIEYSNMKHNKNVDYDEPKKQKSGVSLSSKNGRYMKTSKREKSEYSNKINNSTMANNCNEKFLNSHKRCANKKDLTMFPFDREALDYERIQKECFTVDEFPKLAYEISNSSSEESDENDGTIYERKLYGSPTKLSKNDIFQQYTLLSLQETHQSYAKKFSKRSRPDLKHKKRDHIVKLAAFPPKLSDTSPSKALNELQNFDKIASKFVQISPAKTNDYHLHKESNSSISNTSISVQGINNSGSRSTPPLPDFRVDFFAEAMMHRQLPEDQNQQRGFLENCQKSSQNTGAINVTANPMEAAVCTQPRATIVVQQPSLSLDNTVETLLLKNEGDFVSVEQGKDLRRKKQQREENMRQLLDVTNTLTFEELRDFEMRYGSPHHSRSQSVKTPGSRASGRPNQLSLPQQRSRVASMPNTGVEEEYYKLRHFSITGKGVVNRGDSLKSRRSRSNNSVASSNSSTEHLIANQITNVGSARTSATCSLASSRESSTSNPGSGPYRVLMLGSSAVGKSSLVSQFMTSEYLHAYDTSIDDESGEKSVSVLLSGEESELVFIDHAYTDMSPDNCLSSYEPHGYCVIYSSADRSSFAVAERILQSLWTTENIAQKAVILVANKADLARSRVVSPEEGKAMATAYDCKFIETSVGINHNVDELLVGLLSQIRLKLENPEKSRDLFRKRSSRKAKRRACSPLGGAATACLTGSTGTNPSSPMGPPSSLLTDMNTPPGSVHSSPRKYRGSRTSASLKVKGLLGRVWARDSKSKSCENLHVL